MARGYPDYFGQSIWPKYGTTITANGSEDINHGDEEFITDLTLQGILHRESIHLSGLGNLGEVMLIVFVDGAAVFGEYVKDIYTDGMLSGSGAYIALGCWNVIAGIAAVNFLRDIAFRSRWLVSVYNASGAVITVKYEVSYYAVA